MLTILFLATAAHIMVECVYAIVVLRTPLLVP